jgi:hypothetical protein
MGVHCLVTGISAWMKRAIDQIGFNEWMNRIRLAILSMVISSMFLLYMVIRFYTDPLMISWLQQNLLPSPHPLHLLAAYGIVLPFTVFGARRLLISQNRIAVIFLCIWVVSLPVLAYAPLGIQRRLLVGIWTAWIILAISLFDEDRLGRIKYWKPLFFFT